MVKELLDWVTRNLKTGIKEKDKDFSIEVIKKKMKISRENLGKEILAK